MIGKSGQMQDYRTVLDPRRKRKGRLYRALIAAAVIAILLFLVIRDDADEPLAPEPAAVPEQAWLQPSVIEPPVADAETPPAGEPAADAPSVPDGDPAAEEGVAASEAPVADDAPDPTIAAEVAPIGKAEPAPARAEPKAAVARAAPGTRFQVQIDDFGEIEAARALAERLEAAGLTAQLQHRVAVGPFSSAAEADRTRTRLDSESRIKGVTVAAASSDVWLVQVGVFVESKNAEALRGRLANRGYPVLVNGRVVMGPYAARGAAEQAVQGLRDLGTMPDGGARVVALP